MEAAAQFFDGETAIAHSVRITVDDRGLSYSGATASLRGFWPYTGLEAVDWKTQGEVFKLKHSSAPSARLLIHDLGLKEAILTQISHAQPRERQRMLTRISTIVLAALLCLVALGYLLLTVMPSAAARVMPEKWREQLGEQAQSAFLKGYAECRESNGAASLRILASRLFQTHPELAPDFSVQVYKLPVVNAFALPGGRIVLSAPLIATATSPEEVAGVLAHELGHVWNRDPETSVIRIAGLQLLISLASGSEGGSAISNLMGLATLLRYTRSAETRADEYAIELMNAAKVDPMGLRRFFERMKATESNSGTIGSLGNILSTHPGTEERIKKIAPLREGSPEPVLNDTQWKALKQICG